MPVAIAVIAILFAAAVVIVVTANRRRSSTGELSRETKASDSTSTELVPTDSATTDLEAEGRARADDTRASRGLIRRRSAEVTEWVPVDEEELGVSRRQFLNRAAIGTVGISAATLGAGVLAFLWPTGAGGAAAKVNAGNRDDILAEIEATKLPFYVPEAKTYIRPYPPAALPNAEKVYPPNILSGMEEQVVALSQKCVHLGCRVPWCITSQWFECPCHGSKYNAVGEKRDGPAPRGLDRYPVTIEGGDIIIDRTLLVGGPPIGTNTTKQQQEGPSCI